MEPGDEVTVEFTDRPDPTPPEEPETPDAVSMAVAHTALTAPSNTTPVHIFADSTELPKTEYALGQRCFFGVNQPNNTGAPPKDYATNTYSAALLDGGILDMRYEAQWNYIENSATPGYNWTDTGIDGNVNAVIAAGGTMQIETGYTPMHATRQRYRVYPPLAAVDTTEEQSFSDDVVTLDHQGIFVDGFASQRDGFYLMPADVTTTAVEDEALSFVHINEGGDIDGTKTSSQGYTADYYCHTAHHPIDLSTLVVEVDESRDGSWVTWTKVDQITDATAGQKVYVADATGRIAFIDTRGTAGAGAKPATNSYVRASYEYYDEVYLSGTDYTLDVVAGTVTRAGAGTFTVPVPSEGFAGPTIDANLVWVNEPSWSIADGIMSFTNTGVGSIHLRQTASEATGDFEVVLRIASCTQQEGGATGIIVRDATSSNYISWRLLATAGPNGYIRFTQVVGGSTIINEDICFSAAAPITLHLRKTGTSWHAWASDPTPGYQAEGKTITWDWEPSTVGLQCWAGTGMTAAVSVDYMQVITAQAVDDDVLALYQYADTTKLAEWATALVGRYKDRCLHYEYGNEISTAAGWTWNGGLPLYAYCLKAFATAAKAEAPTAVVMNAGWADSQIGMHSLLYDSIETTDFDALAAHIYQFQRTNPDTDGWRTLAAQLFTEADGEGDTAKTGYAGEISAPGGILIGATNQTGTTGGPNERTQAETWLRMLLYLRKMGRWGSVSYWPGVDLYAHPTSEEIEQGAHDGLFSAGDYATPNGLKPVFYAYRNVAQNPGMLIDLGEVQTVGSVVLACADLGQIAAVSVKGSLTCTDAASKPPKVCAVLVGGTTVFAVTVATGDADLVTEAWTATCNAGSSTFAVVGSVSGAQGTATKEVAFESTNGVCSFTIPAGTYTEGQVFSWETFAGDGFTEIGTYARDAEDGAGNITVDCGDASARYLRIDLTREEGESVMTLTQVDVLDDEDANISDGCLYSLEGWQEEYEPA